MQRLEETSRRAQYALLIGQIEGERMGMIIPDRPHQVAMGFVQVKTHDRTCRVDIIAGLGQEIAVNKAGAAWVKRAIGPTQRVLTCINPRSSVPLLL